MHGIKEYTKVHKRYLIFPGIVAIMLFLALGMLTVRKINTDPNIILVSLRNGADWIRFRESLIPSARHEQTLVTTFRTMFRLKNIPKKAIFSFYAMKRATVWLDNQPIYNIDTPLDEWKKVRHVDLTPMLKPGNHELRISVLNRNGHPMLLAYCKAVRLATNENWDCSKDGKTWSKALSADHILPVPLSRSFQRADKVLISHMYIFVPIFLIVFTLTLLAKEQNKYPWITQFTPTANKIHWLLLGAWIVLSINDIFRVPLYAGMDIDAHIDYIMYVANKMRIPLATEGWQMFESPLFYILEAIIYKTFHDLFSLEMTYRLLRVVPLMCGAAQIELSYRALKYAYPEREDLQMLGTVIGGLLPMNIYISLVVGNEPLSGCLTGIVVVLVLRLITAPSQQSTLFYIITGLFLGLALLAKVSAVLIILPAVLFASWALYKNNQPRYGTRGTIELIIKCMGIMLGIAFLVSGWYYLRNYIELGHFFMGGWDPRRGFIWWQDPGYRTLKQFLNFGEALLYPVYSVSSIWNSLYSTMWLDGFLSGLIENKFLPWHYGFMIPSTLFSLLPSAAILIGMLMVFKRSASVPKQVLLFADLCIAIYLSAILYLYLCVPAYSVAKATYMLGLTPCFAILGVSGLQVITRRPLLRATTYGILACWAICSYTGYFAPYNPVCAVEEQLHLANITTNMGKTDEAIKHYKKALIIKPDSAEIHYNLAVLLASSGKLDEAINHYTEALRISPDNYEAHNNLGAALLLKGNVNDAIRHFKEALRIQPNNTDVRNNLKAAIRAKAKIEKLNQSISMLKKALRSDPENPVLHNRLGNLYKLRGDLDKAIEQYQKALSIKPNTVQVLNRLAMVYADKNEHDKALVYLKKIIDLRPGSPGAYYNIACIYARQNKVDDAIKWLKKAIKRGFHNWNLIRKDPDLENIRGTHYYKELIRGH